MVDLEAKIEGFRQLVAYRHAYLRFNSYTCFAITSIQGPFGHLPYLHRHAIKSEYVWFHTRKVEPIWWNKNEAAYAGEACTKLRDARHEALQAYLNHLLERQHAPHHTPGPA